MLDNRLKQPIQNKVENGKIQKLALDANTKELSPQPNSQPNNFLSGPRRFWGNLNFQTKLSVILMLGAAVPIIVLTQGLAVVGRNNAQTALEENLKSQSSGFVEDYVLWVRDESSWQSKTIAETVQAAKIDLQNQSQVKSNTPVLQALVSEMMVAQDQLRPDAYKSFRIITNAQGESVAQFIQTHANYQLGSAPKDGQVLQQVPLRSGINIGDLDIIKNARRTGRDLNGVELIDEKFLQRLGLDKQATVKIQSQPTANLAESKQPFPKNTYPEVDAGTAGLVAMAVQPIKNQGKVIGFAIVGTLLNNSHSVVDSFAKVYNSDVSLLAKDLRVSTTIPAGDSKTRATGTRVAREVANKVLNQGESFNGQTNVIGRAYFTSYVPLYDHQKQLNPNAKPIGIAFVGQSLVQDTQLQQAQLLAYGVGGGILLLVGILAIPIASSFSTPLKRLARFTQKVGAGQQGIRLEGVQYQDEIGILSQELNQMAASIDANLAERSQEAERAKFFTEIATARSADTQSIFNQALKGAREILNADRVVIYRFNSDWSGYITAESVLPGFPRALNNKIEDACISQQLIEAYKKGRVVPTNNVFEAGFHPEHLHLMERLQIKANLVTPIIQGEELFGLLIAHHCQTTHQWQPTEIDFLTQMSAQLGLILDRVNSLEQTQAAAERAGLVRDITVKLAQATQADNIFNIAVTEIRTALRSDRVVIYSFNELWQGTVTAESVATGFPKAMGAKIDDPCFANKYVERYRAGRVQATNNIHKAGLTACYLKQLEAFAVQANLVAPILQGGQLLGLLIAHQCSAPRNWEQADIDMFSQLATQVGFALDRANLLEQQKTGKEYLQKRALELLIEVDPVSRGDLTIRANVTEDEIGTVADSYNSTIGSLRKIVSQVQQAAIQVAATTTSNESSVQGLSTEALRQTQEIAAALEQVQQMSNSIRAVADNASQAEIAVKQANATVQAGDAAMNRTVDGILAIRETVAETSKKVKLLGESSQKISQVVNLISRFAAQTNLLALKASIEAARAGEEGRGFAVLADEVRALARQSAEATGDIEALVKDIQTETSEVVAAMEAGTEQVAAGTRLVDETRQSLNKITVVSNEIGSLVAAIAQAAAIQSQASESVTHKMSDVAAIAGKTSTDVTSVSASFKELQAVAQELQASVGQFKVN